MTTFETKYGKKSGDNDMTTFQNGYIGAMFSGNGRAYNVWVNFEMTSKKRVAKQEAIQAATAIIPKDAVKVKEWKQEEGKDVIQYESNQLAKALDGYYAMDSKVNPGTFLVLFKYDKNGVFSIVVGAGNKP